jgi:hypothetical protein
VLPARRGSSREASVSRANRTLLTVVPIGVAIRHGALNIDTFDDPGANSQFPQSRSMIDRSFLRGCMSNHVLTTVSPSSHHSFTTRFSLSSSSNCQRFPNDKPNKAEKEPGTHHNSPQTPKTRFSHSKVVRPRLLTLLVRGNPLLP